MTNLTNPISMEESTVFSTPIIIRGNSPFIKISFEGQELIFLVDSGAGLSVLDQKYIQLPEEMSDESITLSGIGDNSVSGKNVMVFFGIGDRRFRTVFTVSDMGETFRAFKESLGGVAGILGGDFLSDYGVSLDYGKQELRMDSNKIEEVMRDTLKSIG